MALKDLGDRGVRWALSVFLCFQISADLAGGFSEKIPHGYRDLLDVRHECKVPRVQELDGRVRIILLGRPLHLEE